ncbi:hypothetical protein GGX14DRAFT_611983 [Mycena pura]|uniref:Uncharacterized protein n=1 Tax=Mycena pura TaxID=153505 RepID=A0AAD6YSR1_9AGAR|nr:hypothetical protein GGX14DRAFT_611983 [Mycena pura]
MDDAESLFGSPPPTPTRGRSPSPALALPSVSGNIVVHFNNSAQNVGTIALPGTHNVSELSVNPLALSLSHRSSQDGDAPRPPAHRSGSFATQVRSPDPTPAPSAPVPQPLSKEKTVKKPQGKSTAAARPTPPPIHLPHSSQSHSLPQNLMRSQLGLLGTAGVVAGIRPSRLPASPAPSTRGSTPSNVIVVDDDSQPLPTPRTKKSPRLDIDHKKLPTPSNPEIVSALVERRDIFPLLESILKFIAQKSSRSSTERSRSQSCCSSDAGSRAHTPNGESRGAKKRRKLRHVPAGADLWDVPFPFNEGEGPETYRADWERERGKKLIAELVTVIKSAARTAAMKKYLERRKTPTDAELAALGKHYRIDTIFYPDLSSTPKPPATKILADASSSVALSVNTPPLPPPAPSSAPPTISDSSTPFDQLISSLLSNDPFSLDSGSSDGFFDSSSPLDPALFNSWMDILQTFPVPAEGFTPDFQNIDFPVDPNNTLTSSLEGSGTPGLSFDFPFNVDEALPLATELYDFPTTFDDSMIDPALLALSAPTLYTPIDTNMSGFSDSGCPSLTASPFPSASSVSTWPMTPSDAGWGGDVGAMSSSGEVALDHEVNLEPTTVAAGLEKGKKRNLGDMTGWTDAEAEALSLLEVLSNSKGKGKARANADEEGGQDGPGILGDCQDTRDGEFAKVPTVRIVGRPEKADVLKRAKARREELVREIERTRIALWETSIEGGVLAGLVKCFSKI